MNIETSYITAFLVGLFGGVHCVGMCGGIMGALTFGLEEKEPKTNKIWSYLISYNLARISSYTLAGALIGGLGAVTLDLITLNNIQNYLLIIAGVFMILLGLYLANWWRVLVYVEQAGSVIWKIIQPYGQRFIPVKTLSHAFALGLIWGWLPCGLVYSVLIWALASASAFDGGLLMLCFGLGTLPNLMAMGIFTSSLKKFFHLRSVRILAGVMVMLFGCIEIIRAVTTFQASA
jgi:sulfite exporter TauE/SafE